MGKPTESNTKPRRRRTPEQARAAILEVARQRLGEHGLDGLNVVDVARDTGISHATLIHHFGTADGMRSALVSHMTSQLLRDGDRAGRHHRARPLQARQVQALR